MYKNKIAKAVIISGMLCAGVHAQQPFNSSKFITVGRAGNTGDPSLGAVAYEYRIAKYVVSVADWERFYNVFSSVGGVGTLNSAYADLVGYGGATKENAMAVRLSTSQAAQYCNWLTTGSAVAGPYTIGTDGAVTGVNRSYRNTAGIVYVIANENEWYKAAFYKPDGSGYSDYTDGSDTAPSLDKAIGYWYGAKTASDSRPIDAGPAEQNGTYNMMGLNWEWVERTGTSLGSSAVARGGRTLPSSGARLTSQNIGLEGAQTGVRVVVLGNPARLSLVIIH